MYGPKDLPGVGKVDFSWVNMPLPPVAVKPDGGGAMEMEGVEREREEDGGGHEGAGMGAGGEVDYDVAEEDERWMVS
jgi:hypothetical protein